MFIGPNFDSHHIAFISELLLARGHVNVLEYGSGNSTLYWPRLLSSCGRSFSWVAIEHVKEIVQKVIESGRGMNESGQELGVELRYIDCGFEGQLPGFHRCGWAYAGQVTTLAVKPDVVIVDGRWRAQCVLACRDALAGTGAIILLHDAQREYYARAFEGIDKQLIDKHPGLRGDLWVVTV